MFRWLQKKIGSFFLDNALEKFLCIIFSMIPIVLFSSNSLINLIVNKRYQDLFISLFILIISSVVLLVTVYLIIETIKFLIKKNMIYNLRYKLNIKLESKQVKHQIDLNEHFNLERYSSNSVFLTYKKKSHFLEISDIYNNEDLITHITFKPFFYSDEILRNNICINLKELFYPSNIEKIEDLQKYNCGFKDEIKNLSYEYEKNNGLELENEQFFSISTYCIKDKIISDILTKIKNKYTGSNSFNYFNMEFDLEEVCEESEIIVKHYFKNILISKNSFSLGDILSDKIEEVSYSIDIKMKDIIKK